MTESSSLTGQVAVVTGAGSGLGEATAGAIARAGGIAACLDLNVEGARRVANGILDIGGSALAVSCDVSDPASVEQAVQTVLREHGRIDIAVNCAGCDVVKSVDEMSVAEWDRIVNVNLRGPFLVAKAVLPAMRRQRSGIIINIASTAGVRAWGNAGAYHASKWGVIGFGRGLGVEGRTDNIRVTTVIPGGMRTHWFDQFPEQGIPLPDEAHLQDPATVASAIVFAASLPPESSLQEFILTPLTETSWP